MSPFEKAAYMKRALETLAGELTDVDHVSQYYAIEEFLSNASPKSMATLFDIMANIQ